MLEYVTFILCDFFFAIFLVSLFLKFPFCFLSLFLGFPFCFLSSFMLSSIFSPSRYLVKRYSVGVGTKKNKLGEKAQKANHAKSLKKSFICDASSLSFGQSDHDHWSSLYVGCRYALDVLSCHCEVSAQGHSMHTRCCQNKACFNILGTRKIVRHFAKKFKKCT